MAARKPKPVVPKRRSAGAPPAHTEDAIYERIHGAVLDHRLQPGTKLKEVALAEVFGVNRNVVRKVLARLAFAKLIDQRPNHGATVASPSVEESRDLFAARRAIEGAIVDAAARRVTPADVRKLRAMAIQEHDAYRKGEQRRGLKLSLQFHRELASVGGNGVMAEMLDQLMARTPLVVLSYQGRGGDNSCSNDEHGGIVDAIASGDTATAVAAMTAHLTTLESQLDLSPPGDPPADLAVLFNPAA